MILDALHNVSGLSKERLIFISSTASKRYKSYTIPKRNGGKREIAQPSRELKAFQRWIVAVLLNHMPLHEAATAYKKGSSIRKNAALHTATRFTNRYDFADFFPSFSQEAVIQFISQQLPPIGIQPNEADLVFLSNILCRNGRLTIGAPSSPALTNAMMYEFDKALYRHCQSQNLVYTRYADDIFISAYEENRLTEVDKYIRKLLDSIPYLKGLKLKNDKTAYLSKKYKRTITGVTITTDSKISIGRGRKREIRALIHLWKENRLSGKDKQNLSYLKGLLAFAVDVEPALWQNLCQKYGPENMKRLRDAQISH